MNYHINPSGSKPVYLQLYECLKKDIVTSVYPYGWKLPSKRILAEETGVSVLTVQHAYEILCEEGYLEGRQRSGYFVIYKDSEFFSATDKAAAIVETDNPPFFGITEWQPEETVQWMEPVGKAKKTFPFSVLSKTMRKVLLDYGENILVKSPNHGCRELRTAIVSYLARSNGITVRPEQIIIGSGAEYLYSLLVQLLGKERVFGLESPSYDKIRRVYEANGVTCDFLKLGHSGIKTTELERTEATVLHITPFNSFPSGITASVSKRQEYLNWAKRRGAYIIEDNYDSELTVSMKNDDTVFAMAEEAAVIYLNTFSETIAPSMRVGYLVLPEKLLETFEEKLGFYSCTVPVFEQYVLAELINNGDFERHINRVRRERRKKK